MDDHSSKFFIVKMSETLSGFRSRYYRWRSCRPSDRELENKQYTQQILLNLERFREDLRQPSPK